MKLIIKEEKQMFKTPYDAADFYYTKYCRCGKDEIIKELKWRGYGAMFIANVFEIMENQRNEELASYDEIDWNEYVESVSKKSRKRKPVLESPTSTVYTDVDTYIIPGVYEQDADEIINFAARTNGVEDCVWTSVNDDFGQVEVTADTFIFRMILLWAYRKGLVSTEKRITDIMQDNNIYESKRSRRSRSLKEQNVEIEVKNKGILEVPEGKNVDDLPMSHFEKLVKKNGLSKITKALNNLQVWNKNDDPKLSKWAGDMIDKLNKKLKKDESFGRLSEAKPRQTITVDIPKKEYDFHFKGVDEDGWKRDVNRVQVIYGHKGQFVELVLIDDNGVRLSSARKKFKIIENDIVLTDYDKNDIVIGKIDKIDTNESFIKESGVKSYWRYNYMNIPSSKDSNGFYHYYDKNSIRRIRLTPCDSPDDCYTDNTQAVCNYEYPYQEVFCTKDQAYEYLLAVMNNSIYEREHDI